MLIFDRILACVRAFFEVVLGIFLTFAILGISIWLGITVSWLWLLINIMYVGLIPVIYCLWILIICDIRYDFEEE